MSEKNIFDRVTNFFNKTLSKKVDEKTEEIQLHAVAFLIKTVAEEMLKVVGRINEMSDAINKHSEAITEIVNMQELIIQKMKSEHEFGIKDKIPKKEELN